MTKRRGWGAPVAVLGLVVAGCSGHHQSAAGGTLPSTGTAATTSTSPQSTSTVRPPSTSVSGDSSWLGYQATLARTGALDTGPGLDPAVTAWTADLGGVVHAEAVVAAGKIFVATENNQVFALDPGTGRVMWTKSLGPPLTDVGAVAGCGDIDPLGITSTPVVDPRSATLYVVGEVSSGGGLVHHQLEAFDLSTGAVKLSEDVDPPLPAGETSVNLLQRAALALGDGRVYVAYGGNYGDCGSYHGWIVGVAESGPPDEVSFEVASDGDGGAIWESGGGPAIDASGDLYVTTGNANPDPPEGGPDPKKYTESVVKLSPALVPVASFKDEVAGGDEDLATGNPVLLPDGDVFAVGKTDIGYVLTGSTLVEVAAIKGICGSDPDGGPAYDASTNRIFVPCRAGGLQEVDLAGDTLGPRLSGANSTPILVGTHLWAVEYPDGQVTEYDALSGDVVQTLQAGGVPTFASPSFGLGLLIVPTDSGVRAFKAGG